MTGETVSPPEVLDTPLSGSRPIDLAELLDFSPDELDEINNYLAEAFPALPKKDAQAPGAPPAGILNVRIAAKRAH